MTEPAWSHPNITRADDGLIEPEHIQRLYDGLIAADRPVAGWNIPAEPAALLIWSMSGTFASVKAAMLSVWEGIDAGYAIEVTDSFRVWKD